MAVGDRVVITSAGCSIDIKDPNTWFDLSSPCGVYTLNLNCPYDRAVSFALLRLTAGHQRMTLTGAATCCVVLICCAVLLFVYCACCVVYLMVLCVVCDMSCCVVLQVRYVLLIAPSSS